MRGKDCLIYLFKQTSVIHICFRQRKAKLHLKLEPWIPCAEASDRRPGNLLHNHLLVFAPHYKQSWIYQNLFSELHRKIFDVIIVQYIKIIKIHRCEIVHSGYGLIKVSYSYLFICSHLGYVHSSNSPQKKPRGLNVNIY